LSCCKVKLADILLKMILPVNFLEYWPPKCLAIQFATTQYIPCRHDFSPKHGIFLLFLYFDIVLIGCQDHWYPAFEKASIEILKVSLNTFLGGLINVGNSCINILFILIFYIFSVSD